MSLHTYHDIAKMIDHSARADHESGGFRGRDSIGARVRDVASVCIVPSDLKALRGAAPWLECEAEHDHRLSAWRANHGLPRSPRASFALGDGAVELDMVINPNRALSGDWDYVRADIRAVLDGETLPGRGQKA